MIPGNRRTKRSLLQGLDEESFVDLVADLLIHTKGHSDVRVVDGPGDGRRDIHSTDPKGARHVTQCKFHRDSGTAVSSRETDELAIGLTKFGAKVGLFATTGRLSPQAKREYLDNFPDFSLEFWEGSDIVDQVMSSPTLAAVWSDGMAITAFRSGVMWPCVVRRSGDDTPVTLDLHPGDLGGGVTLSSSFGDAPRELVEPYRSPSRDRLMHGEVAMRGIRCNKIALHGAVHLHDLDRLRQKVLQRMTTTVPASEVFLVRFGTPCLIPQDRNINQDLNTSVRVPNAGPWAYVVSGGTATAEEDWILPRSDNWTFPRRFSTLEADWASWYSPMLDALFRVELHTTEAGWFDGIMANSHRFWHRHSGFLLGRKRAAVATVGSLQPDAPDLSIAIPGGRTLLGWLHPFARQVAGPIPMDPEGLLQGDQPGQGDLLAIHQAFCARRDRALGAGVLSGMEILDPERAEGVAKAEQRPILLPPAEKRYYPCELVHYFDEIPSPVDLRALRHVLVVVWRLPRAVRVRERKIAVEGSDFAAWVRYCRNASREQFAIVSLRLTARVDQSTTAFLAENQSQLEALLGRLEGALAMLHGGAVRITADYWKDEVGIHFNQP